MDFRWSSPILHWLSLLVAIFTLPVIMVIIAYSKISPRLTVDSNNLLSLLLVIMVIGMVYQLLAVLLASHYGINVICDLSQQGSYLLPRKCDISFI